MALGEFPKYNQILGHTKTNSHDYIMSCCVANKIWLKFIKGIYH